ncbi:MAG: UDP-3-O-(3-hydroxymyristoyl)glucosamine N-acyltransferase [Cellvibrio sp.]|nr:UDP-3-O-(3-hydroxymyristoyl)glucosamine N-acyltransferase [Cellvibrio sp.]
MRSYSLREVAQLIDGELHGDEFYVVNGLASLQSAEKHHISFIANPVYKKYLSTTAAGAVLINAALADDFLGNKLIVAKPYEAYAKLTEVFATRILPLPAIHPDATVSEKAKIGNNISIGPKAVISDGVVLGDNVVIGAGCYLGADTEIGAHTELMPNVTVYHGIKIGGRCLLHSGCVIGADGFGFAPTSDGWLKIHQLGGVIIGDRVEIGANTCIDRGALEDTVIEDGVIIDNLVQIAHNVKIGRNTAIAGHTAIAGSTVIGSQCTIAGAVGIVGHLEIADKVHITAMSLVTSSITQAGSYSSGTAMTNTKDWRKNAARFRQLDEMANRLLRLEREKKL